MVKIRIPILVLLFATAAVLEAGRLTALSAISGADVWWHLSSGLWILTNHALPHRGVFSQAGGTWIAASWAYDLLLGLGYKLLGLRAIPVLLMCFKAALAVVTFVLAGGLRGRFWTAVGLSAVVQYILGAVPPGPTYFSILFFTLEWLLLLESRRTQDVRPLLWLPALMVIWANVDPQFVHGVTVLAVFLVDAGEKYFFRSDGRSLDFGKTAAIVGLSIVATFVTPYLYRPYGVFFATRFSSANQYLGEFLAPGFRQAQDYLLILLAMAAFLVLGLRRSRDRFAIVLLGACAAASFYSMRDIWLVALAALAVIGEANAQGQEKAGLAPGRRDLQMAGAVALVILIVAAWIRIPRSRDALLAKVGQGYPVAACDSIRGQQLARPLFNAYQWGGFLTWYLPQYPVAIDSRNDLYGADFITDYSKVMNAEVPYTEYPALKGAQTILLPRSAIMAGALSSLPLFKVAYSDDAAVVLTRDEQP
jgi:hypothetical protein